MFSERLPPHLEPNSFSLAITELRKQGVSPLDLTVTNPTQVGLDYPPGLLDSLANADALLYEPSPLGLVAAREAVASEMSSDDVWVEPEQVILTASTSEAYSVLFKLLCDAGDCVLVPQPSYPLFELLTRLDLVQAVPYKLDHHGAWSIDRDSMSGACGPRTRAVLVVSPNNPTGSMLRDEDREWLVEFAQAGSYAIISDEVFAGYPIVPRADAVSMLGESRVLTFTLGGPSKSAGLPQVKLGWIVVSGPGDLVRPAMERLEVICDTYLSVSTPVQLAAGALISAGEPMRGTIRERVMQNFHELMRQAREHPSVRVLEPEAGWSAVVQVPETVGEEALVLQLLREAHVAVHPGYFFDFRRGDYIVVSLLPQPDVFAEGMRRVLEQVTAS